MVKADEINRELRMLWKETIDTEQWPATLRKLWPLQYQNFDTPTLVLVGMNPAYAKRDERIRQETQIEDTSILLDENGSDKLCKEARFADAPYFHSFDSFIKDTPLKHWAHLDIFAVRETNQKLVRSALALDNEKWTDFAEKQFGLFLDLLKQVKPPAIVVPNSYASHILCSRLGAGRMSPDHFCHHIRLDGLEVPIFFSGMLSGQHAMDVYSKERLIYQVRKVLRSL